MEKIVYIGNLRILKIKIRSKNGEKKATNAIG